MTGRRHADVPRRPPPGAAGSGPASSRGRAAVRAPAALLVLLLFAAVPAAADYRRNYLDGRRALERGEVERALALFAEAARERPEEQARARLVGAIPEPYLPHHYLGLAHFRARSCPQALAEWDVSARQGAVAQVPEAQAESSRHRSECEDLARAEQAVAEAGDVDDALAAELARGGPSFRPSAAFAARRRAAKESLAAARSHLTAARRDWDFAAVASADEAVRRAAGELAALREEWGRELVGRAGASNAEQPGASRSEETATVEERAAAGGELPAAAPAGPSADLLAGVQAYLDGDYRGALARLGSVPAATARDRFLAALFRAASYHALYLLGGERESAFLRAAEAGVAACRREQPGWLPSPDEFSPRFVRFYLGAATLE